MVAAIDLNRASPDQRTDSRVVFAGTFAIVLTVAEMALDAATWVELDVATIYGIPLVLAAFARQRTLLWALTAALAVATFVIYAFQIPVGTFELHEALFVNRVLDAVALLLIAGLLHVWTASLEIREAQAELLQEQKRKLEAANALLVDHEAQIVRQNAAERRGERGALGGERSQIEMALEAVARLFGGYHFEELFLACRLSHGGEQGVVGGGRLRLCGHGHGLTTTWVPGGYPSLPAGTRIQPSARASACIDR